MAFTFSCVAPAAELGKTQIEAAARAIDAMLERDLTAHQQAPLALVDDGRFLRRSYLNIIGRIPTEAEARDFLNDPSRSKRSDLIDKLCASPGFDSHLFNWVADLLRVQTNHEEYGLGWHTWLRSSITQNKPWDDLVREMLSATGHTSKNPAVGYYLRDRNMQLDNFSNTMQVFLGQQVGCAQCHDHPFDDLTQYDYYQMAAFTGGMEYRSEHVEKTVKRVVRDQLDDPATRNKELATLDPKQRKKLIRKSREKMSLAGRTLRPLFRDFHRNAIFENPQKSLKLPDNYQYLDAQPGDIVPPQILFGDTLAHDSHSTGPAAFAEWVTSEENPYFTKVMVNRMWKRAFGYGLLEPVDDWKDDSQPAHPQVLELLEKTMKAVAYDLREFSRVIYQTELFQRECDPVEPIMGQTHLLRGPRLRRMTAEQLVDSMIVLKKGRIDDNPTEHLNLRWERYVSAAHQLLAAESNEILLLAESALQIDEKFREKRSELSEIQTQIAAAETPEARRAAGQEARDVREQLQSLRLRRDPLKAALSGMTPTMMQSGMMAQKNRDYPSKQWLRASEQEAPFHPASLVREFGGSDRETPSSSDKTPTVPQALALLNDHKTDIVSAKNSYLKHRFDELKNSQQRLETLFLCIYSSPPSKHEFETLGSLTRSDAGTRDLAQAMLTSKRFIFIP